MDTESPNQKSQTVDSKEGNEPVRPKRTVWFYLVVVILFFNLVLLVTVDKFTPEPLTVNVLIACFATLASAIGAFSGLASHRFRWLIGLVATMLLGGLPALGGMATDGIYWVELFCCGVFLVVAAATHLICRLGSEFRFMPLDDSPNNEVPQFGIKRLFVWTTVVAVLAVFVQWISKTRDLYDALNLAHDEVYYLSLAFFFGAGAVMVVWTFLGAVTCEKFFVALVGTGLIGLVLTRIFTVDDPWVIIPGFVFGQTELIVLTVLVRLQGFRLLNRRP